jgi:hypothetical protein
VFTNADTSQNHNVINHLIKNLSSKTVNSQQLTILKVNRAKHLVLNDNENTVNSSYGDIASMFILLKKLVCVINWTLKVVLSPFYNDRKYYLFTTWVGTHFGV